MKKPIHIVATTINKPYFLYDYFENINKYNHLDEVIFWIIGDHKTPPDCKQICQEINQKGLEVQYLGITEQDQWGKKIPELYNRFPYNNEARRNLGYLLAYENECEILISIDDDNYPTDQDFIGGHKNTGQVYTGSLLREPCGYLNICEFLEFQPQRMLYPRGYPFNLRDHQNQIAKINISTEIRIGLTEGLWLRDPDIDAITWLNGTVKANKYIGPKTFVLSHDTWSPINTQNTSVVRELIPAFICVPMGVTMPWGRIERFGDIMGGYFFQAIINNSNYHTAFGLPLLEHRRNPHNYLNDLQNEYWGMLINDWLLDQIRSFSSNSISIVDRVYEFSDYLLEIALIMDVKQFPPEAREFIKHTANTLKYWGSFFDKNNIR